MEQSWDLREAVCRIGVDGMVAVSDESLMFLLRNETVRARGNEVFAEMHRRYQGRVLSWCRRLTRNREGANDLTQEIFLRAFRYRHTFRGDSSLSTWLYVITRNYCMNALKKCGRDPIEGADLVSPAVAGSDGTETHAQVANSQAFEAMWALIHQHHTPIDAGESERSEGLHRECAPQAECGAPRPDAEEPPGNRRRTHRGGRLIVPRTAIAQSQTVASA